MCGRRKREREYPETVDWGDMPIDMVRELASQIPKGVFIQLHRDGEPLLYPYLSDVMELFEGHYMGLDTNGKLLMEKKGAIAKLSTITISVIPDDPEGKEQLEIAEEFLKLKNRPAVMFRLLGDIDYERSFVIEHWCSVYPKVDFCRRILHKPEGSFGYTKEVTKPEHGICEEMLHKLAIDRYGNVYPCVRFDPEKKNILGNISGLSLADLWESVTRKLWVQYHINFRRDRVPLCGECHFYGIPRG